MNLVINKCVTAVILSNFSGHYLRNHSTLDIGVLGYIGVLQLKEHSPKVWHIPPGTPCIYQLQLGCHPVAAHIYTQTIHRTTQITIKQHK